MPLSKHRTTHKAGVYHPEVEFHSTNSHNRRDTVFRIHPIIYVIFYIFPWNRACRPPLLLKIPATLYRLYIFFVRRLSHDPGKKHVTLTVEAPYTHSMSFFRRSKISKRPNKDAGYVKLGLYPDPDPEAFVEVAHPKQAGAVYTLPDIRLTKLTRGRENPSVQKQTLPSWPFWIAPSGIVSS